YWSSLHPSRLAGPRIAIVSGPVPATPLPPSTRLHGTLAPGALVAAAAAAFALLLLTGLPWVMLLLGRTLTPGQKLATAPGVGIAAIVIVGVAASRLGAPLSGYGGAAVALLAGGLGWVLVGLPRRRAALSAPAFAAEPPPVGAVPAKELADR
ncbi:MAG TPA: hypothetical protein VMU66_07160, partial [Gaiellales bacterium]|nr:hypothetical protein [Gaiellales bacterium]